MVARLTKITSSSATVRYFENDSGIAPSGEAEYYADQDFEHKAASAWFGRGAQMLKLRGPVEVDDFKDVLSGRVPGKGIQLGRRVLDEETGRTRTEHNPGDDLTFSAPKSVSLAALHFQEGDALDAHDKAVAATLLHVQRYHIDTRRNRRRESAGRMVAAIFRHDTSRNHDPQLHTHSIIANMTRRDDGEWISIDRGSVSLNERVIEAYYHNELAKNLRERGYKLRPVQYGGKRIFEIEGYRQDVLDAFSTRKWDILRDLSERGIRYSTASRQRAALRTRRAKEAISRKELHRRWNKKALEMGFENPSSKKERRKARKEVRKLRKQGIEDPLGRDIEADLYKAINTALEHLGYHTPVIADTAIKATVMGHLAGRVTLEQIDGALSQLEKDGHLYRSKKRGSRGAWVTREALQAEKAVVRYMREGRGKVYAIRRNFDQAIELRGSGLTPGQASAIESILTSTDKVSGVQGYAGTGKTTMLRTLVEQAKIHRFIGLAPTVGASVLLGSEAGIPSRTLQSFLAQHKDIAKLDGPKLEALRKEFRNTVVVVDEASMMGTRHMKELFTITERLGVERLVLVGDKKQLRSIEAGQPFIQLQQKGMETAVMEDIVRQKHEGLKVPVEMMLAGKPSCALQRLGDEDNKTGRIVEVDREDIHQSAAGLYLGLSEEERRGTILMAQTNHDRQEINARIREGLEEEGHLGGVELEGIRLVPRHMTPSEKADALNYYPGDVLVFQSKFRTESGEDHFTVKEVGRDGRLTVETESGEWRHFNPGKGNAAYRFEVYNQTDISLMEKDRVRITRNDPDLRKMGVVNGAEATVEKIGRKSITLRLASDDDRPNDAGRVVKLDQDHIALKHLDHGYCRTTYSAQGRTADRVIAVADTGLGHIADQQNFYVQISRASEEAVVVTDDIVELGDSLTKHTGEVLSAMEAVGDTGWEFGQDKDIEISVHGVQTEAQDEEIQMPELSLPDHFPPELAAMLNSVREEAAANIEMGRKAEPQALPDGEQIVEQQAPATEGKEMAPDEAADAIKQSPEGIPNNEPEATTLEELAEQLRQRIDGLPEEPSEHDTGQNDDAPALEKIHEIDKPAMGEIGNGVIQVDSEELAKETARNWLSLPEEVREKTGILATPGYLRSIERDIRSKLERQGRLHGPEIEVDRLSLVPLSEKEKLYYLTYSRGDMVLMKQDDYKNNIKADSWVKVKGWRGDGNGSYVLSVEATNSLGRTSNRFVGIDKFANCQVYRENKMKLRAGDRVRWRRDSEQHGIVATQKADVTRVVGNNIRLRMQNDREAVLAADSKLFKACDYSFNLTTWEFEKGAVENVIAVTKSRGYDHGVVEAVAKEFGKKAGNAVLVTDEFNYMNRNLEKADLKSIDVGDGVKGLIADKGGIEIKSEGRGKGMGMGI